MGTTGHLVPLPPLLPTFVTLSTLSTPRPHSATLPGYHLMRTSRATVWVAPLSVLRSLIPLLQPLLTPPMRPNGKIPPACGAGVYYEQRAQNGNPAAASNLPVPANIPGAGNTVGSGQNKAQAPATDYAVAGPAVNAQCGT